MNNQYSFNHFLDFFCPFKGILGDTPIFNINFTSFGGWVERNCARARKTLVAYYFSLVG